MDINNRRSRKINFTKKAMDGLPAVPVNCRSKAIEYSDQQVIGLRASKTKGGRVFYDLRYVFNQRKKAIRIGEHPVLSVADARNLANDYKRMLSFGLDPQIERTKQSNQITFQEFGEREYMPFAKENKKSWRDDELKFEKDLYPAFGKHTLSSISARDVQKLLTKIKARASAGTHNKYLTLISRMFNLAIQWQFVKDNPCKFIKKQKETGQRERYLNSAEIKNLLAALDTYDANPSADAIRFLLFTGLRMSEALKLTWKDVDLEAGTAFLSDTKSGRSRVVVLNELSVTVLADIRSRGGGSDYVFPGKFAESRLMSPKRVFENVKKVAGIEDFTIHSLRHTFASILANNGVNLYEIQHLLGHQSSKMTQRYAHLGSSELRTASESVSQYIERAVG